MITWSHPAARMAIDNEAAELRLRQLCKVAGLDSDEKVKEALTLACTTTLSVEAAYDRIYDSTLAELNAEMEARGLEDTLFYHKWTLNLELQRLKSTLMAPVSLFLKWLLFKLYKQ